MTNLPVGPIQTSEALARRQQLQERAILEFFEVGDFMQLAEKLGKGDPKKAKMWRTRFRRWIQEPFFLEMLGRYAKGELALQLPAVVMALNRRAAKGNVPAAKLAMETSGFYSPKSQLEHTGEVQITIKNAPRPVRTEDENVVDADVVE
jgi:hypothetical protein